VKKRRKGTKMSKKWPSMKKSVIKDKTGKNREKINDIKSKQSIKVNENFVEELSKIKDFVN